MRKLAAESVVSGHEPDQTNAAVPQTNILTSPASGKRGPIGTAPRTNYSRVNTGTPGSGEPDGGAQKTMAPMGLANLPKLASKETNMSHTGRPMLQALVKTAMEGATLGGLRDAAARASGTYKLAGEESEEEKRKKEEAKKKSEKDAGCKTASADISKLAAALYELADMKLAEGPGQGPGALPVHETAAHPAISHETGKAVTQLPAPSFGKGAPAHDPHNQMANDVNDRPGGSAPQKTSLPGDKTASDGLMIQRLLIEKRAEDAINPAHISAGSAKTTELPKMETLERPASVPGHASLVGSNERAESFTRGDAKAQERADLKAVLDEPALSRAHDKDLANALTHNTGSKIASLEATAARAYLQKLASSLPATPAPTTSTSRKHPEY